jgi:hypothetical protein
MLHGCFREAAKNHILAHHRTEWNPTTQTCPRTEPQEHKDLGEVNWGKWVWEKWPKIIHALIEGW